MAFEITMTNALEHKNVSLVVAGPPGVGKTPFALTSPDPFLLNVEAGLQSVAHREVPTTRITSMADLLEVKGVLAKPEEERKEILGFDVSTVIIDTIDEVSRIAAHERMEREQKTEMGPGDWGWLADELNALVRGFRGLDMNLILVTHTKDQQNGETGEITHKPDISGAFGHQLPAAVDIVGLMERRVVFDETEETANKTFFVSHNRRGYDWLKNRGRLPDAIEMNFEDDFECIHETFFSGVEYAPLEVKVIETQAEEEGPSKDPGSVTSSATNKTVEEVRAQIDAAQDVMADAATVKEQKNKEAKKPVLTQPIEEIEDLDLSNCYDGEAIKDPRFKGGFELLSGGVLRNAPGTRFVYKLEDGTRILSVNQLEQGVKPIPDPKLGTGIFCQVTGAEVSTDQANVSRVKFRKVFSKSEFEKNSTKE